MSIQDLIGSVTSRRYAHRGESALIDGKQRRRRELNSGYVY